MSIQIGIVSTRSGRLNLREQPSDTSTILARLPKGMAVQIIADQGDWYKISAGSTRGYVSAKYLLVQEDDPAAGGLHSLHKSFNALSPQRQALVSQALRMLGEDRSVFDSLPRAQQQDCWGWQFRHDIDHFHHKDIVCADLVYICLKAANVNVRWTVSEPAGTIYKNPHAANYFRPNDWLQEVTDEEPWQPGDILIYWNGDMQTKRLRHVNLYVGPYAGRDLDGRIYSADQPCDVVNASIDYRGSQHQERGTRIRGLTRDTCVRSNLGKEHGMRLRHIELAGQTDASITLPEIDVDLNVEDHPAGPASTDNEFIVTAGQLTFDAEGQEVRGPFFSRKPHVPSSSSGVTLGRGYDMKSKSRAKIAADLSGAGIDDRLVQIFARAAGLAGNAARQFIRRSEVAEIEITPDQQKALFEVTYEEHVADVRRICDKNDVVRKYGRTDWDPLHPAIKDVLVDLRYRGDYTGTTRNRIQPLVVANDLFGLQETMADKAYWMQNRGVPRDRFERRADYMATALQEMG
jgi:hypothetical protein